MARKSSKKVVPFTGAELDRLVLLHFHLQDVSESDVKLYSASYFESEEESDMIKMLVSQAVNTLRDIFSVNISRKLELNQRDVPFFSIRDFDSLLFSAKSLLVNIGMSEEDITKINNTIRNIAGVIVDFINSLEKEDPYQLYWNWINTINDVLKERSIDLYQAEATVELHDEVVRRLYSKEEYSARLIKKTENLDSLAPFFKSIIDALATSFSDEESKEEILMTKMMLTVKFQTEAVPIIAKAMSVNYLTNSYLIDRIYGKN